MVNEGYMDTVKSAIVTHISQADASLSPVTNHVFHNINETANQDKSKTAMDLAEKIKTKLLKSSDMASGIAYYTEITLRETSSRMARVAKVIIEGYVFVKRPII